MQRLLEAVERVTGPSVCSENRVSAELLAASQLRCQWVRRALTELRSHLCRRDSQPGQIALAVRRGRGLADRGR